MMAYKKKIILRFTFLWNDLPTTIFQCLVNDHDFFRRIILPEKYKSLDKLCKTLRNMTDIQYTIRRFLKFR